MPRAEFVLVSDFGILLHCFNHHFVCDNYIHVYSVIVQVHVAEGATSGSICTSSVVCWVAGVLKMWSCEGQSPIELCLSGHCYKRSSRLLQLERWLSHA
ncbi:unnamed protein product [Durusdinium trenchii]|uniref:Uncharacterized protein n=1 Tax=Durusdinium trenchii TaxID=1381693 RepID=A0ABP0NCQ5_9DINO